MTVYALFPLAAFIAYIPLLVITINSRPWHRRNRLFILFLIPAMMWSLTDVLLRSNLFPEYNHFLLQLIVVSFSFTAIQFHVFASSFYAPEKGRWLPLAYLTMAIVIGLVVAGIIPEGVYANGDKLYLDYGKGVIFMAIPLMVLLGRTVSVFWGMLKILDNPILYNQILLLLLGLSSMTFFTGAALLPWGREYPVSHLGNMINAFILSYAIIRHQLVDIRMVLRRGLGWMVLGLVGIVLYGIILVLLHEVLRFEFDITITTVITSIALFIAFVIYRIRDYMFATLGKAFQGQRFDYRQQLSEFAQKIHNVFSLREQGGELLELVTKAVGCERAALLFLETGSQDFVTQFVEPGRTDDPLYNLRLSSQSPIVGYLHRERTLITRESLSILPQFRGLWEQEKGEITANEIELFMPLISRERLIGILVLDKKTSGRYSVEDLSLLEDVTKQVAVSMEKEYLRERLREREEELSVINRCSAIIASNLDIQQNYDSFIAELKKVVDIQWASITLIEKNNQVRLLTVYSEIGSAWKAGERMPLRGTATELVAINKQPLVEPDLNEGQKFVTGKFHLKQGIRSIAYLPLITKGEVIGSFVVGSRSPRVYTKRYMTMLEQLASQIAMSIENSRLYAEAEEMARVDDLTKLLNRRSLNELMASEVNRHARYGGVFCLIILDLDSFKAFNDEHGHPAGDKLLKELGKVLQNTIRNTDQAFRYGGDEFAILLPNTSIDAASQVAERIRTQIATRIKSDSVPMTASLGLANWPADGRAPDEVVAAADAALYRAKREGGNRCYCASGTLLPMEESKADSVSRANGDMLNAVFELAKTADAKEHSAESHWRKVRDYAVLLAEAMNLETAQITTLKTCALLHDIGKIGISERILHKSGTLTMEEWETIKTHPQMGVNIVRHVPQLVYCLPGILHHHERYDGTGYPQRLKGENIPLVARILSIADAFAAMTSRRTYSEALPLAEALEEIKRGAGTQFDPRLAELFCSVVENGSRPATGAKEISSS